jgi:hypothetical protein
MMFQSANAEATNDGFSALAARGHMSNGLPSTRLYSLCNSSHSMQAQWASLLAESLGTRASYICELIFVPPGLVKEGQTRQLGPGDTFTVASCWRSG